MGPRALLAGTPQGEHQNFSFSLAEDAANPTGSLPIVSRSLAVSEDQISRISLAAAGLASAVPGPGDL